MGHCFDGRRRPRNDHVARGGAAGGVLGMAGAIEQYGILNECHEVELTPFASWLPLARKTPDTSHDFTERIIIYKITTSLTESETGHE